MRKRSYTRMLILAVMSVTMIACTSIIPTKPSGDALTSKVTVGTESVSLIDSLTIVKMKGCSAVDIRARLALMLVLRSRIENYPKGGICDPKLIDKFYEEIMVYLENSTSAVHYRPQKVRCTTDCRARYVGYSMRSRILLS